MLCVLVNIGFQVLFHSPPGVLFTFPSQYCSTIGHQVVFRLRGWSPHFPCGFLVPARTPETDYIFFISLTGLSPSMVELPISFCYESDTLRLSLTPVIFLFPVWPLPISLAATFGISFDFSSSAYLDVSLRRVSLIKLCIHFTMHDSSSCGFPHSDTHGSRLIYSSPWLFAVSRVLHRLLMPRHSPYALYSLNFLSCLSFVVIGCLLNNYHL